ncbi:MAG: hypothetical protein COV08_03180 [Candidatus Vogelbacteria bacterium CG10_big_fil_rev_8_21_14_0_10_49_38]|uniref:Uncharacterized protein n=1 Tax=Candidatus Vogelbacteria bacterium CG10_big_fil_rev_8_21_14_0_10_49_38 TaxID=1975043 RepID=A0A2H0RGX6_9BACT|nr:MAG: hypothetical protein BK006_03185 [bacterium CG10_49_38]PIR45802.1 MAG: hypothetical protein COV08_03180 [Candidatus Vogelbacteria bacterium CG10_big_fil_rev_8_21_14_0_10_49_38]
MNGIPKKQPYPDDAVQCGGCGGWGCDLCDDHGWLTPRDHPNGRHCENQECDIPLAPDHIAVYCNDQCALADI